MMRRRRSTCCAAVATSDPSGSIARRARVRRAGGETGSVKSATAADACDILENATRDEEIVFDAGSHVGAIKMRYKDFAELVHPQVAEFHREPTKLEY